MSLRRPLDPTLLQRAEELAREKGVSVESVVERALQAYLGPRRDRKAVTDLPVASRLEFASPDIAGMSYGKLLDLMEDGFPISKLR